MACLRPCELAHASTAPVPRARPLHRLDRLHESRCNPSMDHHQSCRRPRACTASALLQAFSRLTGDEQVAKNPHLTRDRVLGVVIVDHGSKREEANAMLERFGVMFAAASCHDIVEIAHMELAEPGISQAVRQCAERGATHVVVAPYFLSRGRHVQSDIPRLAAEAAAQVPGLHVQVADPIGVRLCPFLMGAAAPCAAACACDVTAIQGFALHSLQDGRAALQVAHTWHISICVFDESWLTLEVACRSGLANGQHHRQACEVGSSHVQLSDWARSASMSRMRCALSSTCGSVGCCRSICTGWVGVSGIGAVSLDCSSAPVLLPSLWYYDCSTSSTELQLWSRLYVKRVTTVA